ncbi:bifunctional diaminohydroxyphosphoribosylaminopyrimidine deaminase/5-amino-6-(5-phosphoribosylamino)uracil reductase RibD [Botrimarina mediterranea]|uniref:Riboflavin biosynthesis protein RibD n=1 Tax=Botrimarina mediterranea TaxID=2528022 RepID=A0A518KEW6_9BACT|nr:bifunctional diaminohydroxyphosphoribosylaminopyrimidine deaminase/5-amino-6-(5-phosphoribosylamino)uracil reductase RibD [Botrimarina mediterranea]QDV76336.1 Riboflavin biosynthesis protein RibD [Botrimarina mediterranea]
MSPEQVDDVAAMRRALQLAARGEGLVEPNPMVGCVVVLDGAIVGEGFHQRFGGPHAEVNALKAAGDRAKGAKLFVTLEPCCHTGKTPPCVEAVLAAGVKRVVIAMRDPFPKVDGGGIRALEAAGVECVVGVLEDDARRLVAPYLKLLETGRPWVIAKWAMTLDGKIATSTLDSQWISNEASRARVHRLRGRVDAVIVGARTLVADDPLLTARPTGPRTPLRIVIAGDKPLPIDRKLWNTPDDGAVLVAVGEGYPAADAQQLRDRGVEVLTATPPQLLDELGRRRLTNVLVEGGGKLLGQFFDQQLIDESWAFVAPKLIGGTGPGPIGGEGVAFMRDALTFTEVTHESIDGDLLIRGRTKLEPRMDANHRE